MTGRILLAGMLVAWGCPGFAQILPNPDYSGEFSSRSTLTGDWGGRRGQWASKGFHVDLDSVTTYQNLFHGGLDEDDGVLGSSALTLQLDTGKAGLWPGGLLKLRSEARYGDGIFRSVGGISPVNADALAPLDPDRLGDDTWTLTELNYVQFLSEKLGVFAGLINTEEGDANELAGSLRDNSRFLNTAFRMSLSEGTTTPNVTLGAGIVLIPTPNLLGSIVIYDTQESAGSNPFDSTQGTSIATEWQYSYELAGRGGRQTLGFVYGFDQEFTQVGVDPRAAFRSLLAGQGLPTKDESWVFYYNGHQYLQWENGRGWGLFGRFSISDGDVNPIEWTAAVGLGGTGMVRSRPKDTWGLGYYHLNFVDGPLFRLLDISDEAGFEAWYNFKVTPWFNLTADVQVIDTAVGRPGSGLLPIIGPGGLLPVAPALANVRESKTAWVFGVRAKFDF